MDIGLLFWVLMVLWLVGWGAGSWGPAYAGHWQRYNGVLLFILLFLLGWRNFGFIIRG